MAWEGQRAKIAVGAVSAYRHETRHDDDGEETRVDQRVQSKKDAASFLFMSKNLGCNKERVRYI